MKTSVTIFDNTHVHFYTGIYVIPEKGYFSYRIDNKPAVSKTPGIVSGIVFTGILDTTCDYEVLAPEGEGLDIHKVCGFGTQTFLGLFDCDSIRLGFQKSEEQSAINQVPTFKMFVYMHQKGKRYIPRNSAGKALPTFLGYYKAGNTFEVHFDFVNFVNKIPQSLQTTFTSNVNNRSLTTKNVTVPWNREIKNGLWYFPYYEEEGTPATHPMLFDLVLKEYTLINEY